MEGYLVFIVLSQLIKEVPKKYFKDVNYSTECGDFKFQFYIFDFKAKDTKYILDDE